MGCCTCLSRCFISLFSVFGLALSAGVFVLFVLFGKDSELKEIISNKIFHYILILAIVTAISSLIGILVCCCKKRCFYIIYFIFYVIFIVFEVIFIILISKQINNFKDDLDKKWHEESFNETRYAIEYRFECCGFTTPDPETQCGYKPETESPKLCYDKITDIFNKYMKFVKIIFIVIIVIEVIMLLCAVTLMCCGVEKAKVDGEYP